LVLTDYMDNNSFIIPIQYGSRYSLGTRNPLQEGTRVLVQDGAMSCNDSFPYFCMTGFKKEIRRNKYNGG
jgi:hypothetical protein